MAVREKNEIETFEWTPEEELQLFLAMEGVKPVGINRHFFMACIVERLSRSLQRDISSESIWTHLRTIYNLKALNEQEPVPFPNDECDFSLPESDFSVAIAKRRQDGAERITSIAAASDQETSKKQEPKTESTVVKNSATKTSSSARLDAKDSEKDDKDTKDRESGSVKIKTKSNETIGGHDSGPKRSQKRTRGSMSTEPGHSNTSSPANTPPNGSNTKRRRI
uniref:MRG-binding protein n=1 Tax=Anopheles farauti TaxID=69004 RepID=A0A182QER3_9DIPT